MARTTDRRDQAGKKKAVDSHGSSALLMVTVQSEPPSRVSVAANRLASEEQSFESSTASCRRPHDGRSDAQGDAVGWKALERLSSRIRASPAPKVSLVNPSGRSYPSRNEQLELIHFAGVWLVVGV